MEEINFVGQNINDLTSAPNFVGKKIGEIEGIVIEDVPDKSVAVNTTKEVVQTNVDDGIKVDYMADTQINNTPREEYFGMKKTDTLDYLKSIVEGRLDISGQTARGTANAVVEMGQNIKRFVQKKAKRRLGMLQLDIKRAKGEDVGKEEWTDWNRRIAVEQAKVAKQNLKFRQELGIAKTEYDGFVYDLANIFPQIGMAVLTKSPPLMSAIFYAQQQQVISEEVFENIKDAEKAEAVATGVAILTAMLEFIGIDKYLKVLKGNKAVKNIFYGFAVESIEEGSQAIVEEIGTQAFGGREKEFRDTIIDTLYQMTLGGIAGGTTAGMVSIGKKGLKEKKIPASEKIAKSLAEKISDSTELHQETADIISKEMDNTRYYGNNIDNGIAEVKKAIQETGGKIEPIQMTPFETLIQEAQGTNINLDEQDLLEILDTYEQAVKRKDELKPKSLIQFIKENGGIYDEQGDLTSRELQKQFPFIIRKTPFIEIQTPQGKARQNIMPDDVALRAWEAGYLDGEERPTVNDLLDAIDNELRGEKQIKKEDTDIFVEREELENLINQIENSGVDLDKIKTLRDYREGKIKLPGELTEEETLKQISEQQIKEAQEREEKERQKQGEIEIQRAVNNINKKITPSKNKKELGLIENALKPISSILKEIDPKIAEKLRTNIRQSNIRIVKWQKEISGFVSKASKMSKKDFVALDMALKNKTVNTRDNLLAKYNLLDEWKKTRKLLDEIYDLATKTGSNFGYEKSYFPRKVKDYSGLLQYFQGRQDWGEMQQYLKERGLETASPQEQAEALSLYISGSVFKKTDTTKRGFEKEKRVDLVTTEMNEFYDNSLNALINYVGNINNSIAINEFFGKNPGTIESGVGELLAGLTNNKKITPNEQVKLRNAIKDYFTSPRTSLRIQTYKNVSYLTGLSNIGSTLTQFKDLYLSLYKNGSFNTLKAVLDKKDITVAEIGINKAMEEIEDVQSTIFKNDTTLEKAHKKIAKYLKTFLKINLFDKIDRFGKNTFVQSTLNKYSSLAKKKNTSGLKSEISEIFGDERADTIINDLKQDNISDEVRNFLFYKISDVVPISRAEMPTAYNRSSGARLFYTFKSYSVKQLDILNQDVVRQIKEGNIAKGFQNLTMLTFYYLLTGVPIDMIKDFIFNRTEDKELINDYVFDNILQIGGVSKWNIYNFKRDGLTIGLLQIVAPPLPVVANLAKDISSEKDFEDWRTAKEIPIGGKMYYWWFGGGAD